MKQNNNNPPKQLLNTTFLFSKDGYQKLPTYLSAMGFSSMSEWDSLFKNLVYFREKSVEQIEIKKIQELIKNTVARFTNEIITEPLQVFIFETKDQFIATEMGGTSGFCTNKNCIVVLINLQIFTHKELENTLVHELAHAVNPLYDMGNMSVGEGIIFEGIAELFRESQVDHEMSKLVSVIPEKEIGTMFKQILPKINSRNISDYHELFFGTGKIPRWTGYAIGYWLVKRILEKQEEIDWSKVLKENPSKFVNQMVQKYA